MRFVCSQFSYMYVLYAIQYIWLLCAMLMANGTRIEYDDPIICMYNWQFYGFRHVVRCSPASRQPGIYVLASHTRDSNTHTHNVINTKIAYVTKANVESQRKMWFSYLFILMRWKCKHMPRITDLNAPFANATLIADTHTHTKGWWW